MLLSSSLSRSMVNNHNLRVAFVCTFVVVLSVTFYLLPIARVSAQQQIDIEETGISDSGPYPNDEFRALALSQLDTIAFMCNHFASKHGEYPRDLYALQASEFWVAEIDNIISGQPIQQIEFTPSDGDYLRDPVGSAIQQSSGSIPRQSPNLPQGGMGTDGSGQGVNQQGNNQQNNAFTYVSIIPPRLDASRIGAIEPGNVLYYKVSDSALQLIMWMNNDVFVDYFQTSPLENDVIRYNLVRELNPTDRSILAMAILIEEVIPRNFSYWQFYTGQDPLLPMDIPKLKWEQRAPMYKALRIRPINAMLRAPIELVKEYRLGMVADFGDGAVQPVYCLHGNRLRTLRELTDPRYLNEHAEEIVKRERLFFGS